MKNSIFIHIHSNYPSKTYIFAHNFDTRDKQGSKENHLQNEKSILPKRDHHIISIQSFCCIKQVTIHSEDFYPKA